MKKRSYFLLLFVTILLNIEANGQHDNKEQFTYHKKKFEEISKTNESGERNKRLIEEFDLMVHYSPNINLYKTFNKSEIEIFKNYLKLFKDKTKTAHINLALGNSLFTYSKPIESLNYFFEAEKKLEKLKDYNCQIFVLLRTSAAFTYYAKTTSGLAYIDKAINIAKANKDTFLLSQSLTYKGDYFMFRNEYAKAIPFFEEINNLKEDSKFHKIVNKFNFGLCYYKIGKQKEGIEILESTLNELPKNDYTYVDYQLGVREDLIKIYLKNNDLLKANEHLKLMKYYSNYPNIYKNDSLRYSLYDYQIQKGLGNYKLALTYLEQRRTYEDSVGKTQIEQQVQGVKAQLALKEQTEKLQKTELERLKLDSERQNQLRWFLIILSVIGLISTIYIFITNRKLRNSNNELIGKNKEISEAMLKGQTIERQRVALDLHDNLGSTLSALWLNVDMIDKSKMNAEERAIHQNLRENLEKAYNDVRLLSHNLLPEEFEKQGLVPTLQSFVRQLSKNSKIRFDLQIAEGFGRVDNKIEFELYSISLELVNNIIKHSKATEAKISLSRTEKQISLIVSDNGIGTFNNESDGKGMKNVKARVESLNGVLEVKSLENQGVISMVVVKI